MKEPLSPKDPFNPYEDREGCWGLIQGVLDVVGFFLALSWPIVLLMFQKSCNP